MPNQQAPGDGAEKPRRRIVRYKALVTVRMEREVFLRVFNASRLSGCPSASDWIRRTLGDAAARELDAYYRSDRKP